MSPTWPNRDHATRARAAAPAPGDLSDAVRRLDAALMELNGALSRELQVGSAGLAALAHLGAGELGPTELARRLDLTTGAVTALLDRLGERGHIVRELDPSDRRRLRVHITPQATEELLGHILPLARDIESIATGFSAGERRAIGRFLDELTTVIRDHASRSSPSRHPRSAEQEGSHVDNH